MLNRSKLLHTGKGRVGLALSAVAAAGFLVWVAPAFASLPSGVTARAMPVVLAGSPSVSQPAVCPGGPTSVGPTSQRLVGVNVTGETGTCTATSAQASDSSATFTTGNGTTVEVTSLTSSCDRITGDTSSSSVFNGETISDYTKIVINKYTMQFNVPTAYGLAALKITNPKGNNLIVAASECKSGTPSTTSTSEPPTTQAA
jgi:hypothetical protein